MLLFNYSICAGAMSPAESIDGIQKLRNAMHIKNSKSSASYHPDGESRCCIQIIWISNSSGLSRQLLYFRRGKERYFKLDNALAEVLVTLISVILFMIFVFQKQLTLCTDSGMLFIKVQTWICQHLRRNYCLPCRTFSYLYLE